MRRVLSAALACAVISAIGVSAIGAQAASSKFRSVGGVTRLNTFHGAKSDSGRIAKSDRRVLHLSGSKITSVLVKLDYDALGSYRGYLPGYAATSPGVTHRSLKANRAAVNSYTRYIARMEDRARAAIARIPKARVTQTYRVAYGGLAVRLPADRISKLLNIPGVVAVQRDSLNHTDVVQEPYQFIGAEAVWPSLGGLPTAASNVTVGVIDTGIWPENPMLVDNGLAPPAGGPYTCDFGDGVDPDFGPDFTCNNKLVGAYDFTATYLAVIGAAPGEYCKADNSACSVRDSEGHGTHTATTAAGDYVDHAPIFGIDRGPTSGLAPGAHVIAYRVCLELGCFTSDSVAAVNQAITDGVNVINYSISGGKNPFSDAIELAFRDFYAAGGLANASAGNSGPGAATSDHGGPWENTVGASYPSRLYLTTLHLSASGGDTLDLTGSSITQGIASATNVVKATDVGGYTGGVSCDTAFAAGSVAGQVVVCARGNPAGRAASSFNVLQGGGAGMILYNPAHQDLFTDNFWVPTVMLDGGTTPQIPHDTDALLAFLSGHTGIQASWSTGTATATTPDIMTTFSSRGPLGDWIKPDITAPGIEILAGNSAAPAPSAVASGPPGENYQAIAGTSMSAPHATGVAALVFATHPAWTPGQVKSAMMTSAVQSVLKPDGVTPADPFNMGAGSIRADRAVHPTLTFDESAADYAALAGTPLARIDANLPSVDAPTMPGTISTVRRAKNVSGAPRTFTSTTTAPPGATIKVVPASFSLAAHRAKNLKININGTSLAPDTQYFGSVTLIPDSGNPVYIPVAFFKKQGDVTLTFSCTPDSILLNATTACTTVAQNLSSAAANTTVAENFGHRAKLSHSNFGEVHNGSSSGGFTSTSAGGYTWDGQLSPSVAPQITSITPDSGPAGGYVSLSAFGVTPLTGQGDETITNFNVPGFNYGQESYTRLGIVSDGYVVVGGGASADVDFVPQTMPNAARPNNVLAPYWTDLNPGAGGAIRIATLTDGSDTWIVVDFNSVPVFGTSNLETFELWIGLNSDANPGEDNTWVYGTTTPDPTPLNAGAENRDGTSGINVSPTGPNTGYRVNTSGPTPGGMVTITYDVTGEKVGSYTLVTKMTSDQTPGTTTATQPLTVHT